MENIPKQVVFADLWPHPTNKQVLITRNSILLDYSSIVRNVGKVLFEQGKTAGETAREWTRVASETGELPWAAKVSAGAGITETVSERMDVHWNSVTAEMDARALSRAVQRDARRYDGGFNAR